MALVRRFFSHHYGDSAEEENYALARDVTSDRVFVLHCRTRKVGHALCDEETKLELSEFLSRPGLAQSELLDLIGTLVVEG